MCLRGGRADGVVSLLLPSFLRAVVFPALSLMVGVVVFAVGVSCSPLHPFLMVCIVFKVFVS